VAEVTQAAIDEITFEVVRHKLQAITEEQATTLKAVSGSPVVTEASDFNNGIYLADGSIVTMGPQVLFHAGTMSTVIRSIIRECSENPGIEPGDMFVLNDPYRGAIHQPDVSIVAPVFVGGRQVAWAGSCAHQLDMGGMNFGSWGIGATQIQQEAMLLPGIKLIERGKLRQDLWRMIMGMSRLPELLGLDLKAMIAANTVAAQRITLLMDRYGIDTVETIMGREIDALETQLRNRLLRLPNGMFRARDYLEHDGHSDVLYEICLAVEKQDDQLRFDFTGSSPEAPGFINCTMSGLRGAVLTALFPILAPNIRWNEGLLRPISIDAPEGSICNASFPAPTSAGTISAAWVAQNVAAAALSRLVACSGETIADGQAVTKGHMTVLTLAGQNRDGGPFGTFLLDSTAGGGGAFIDHDGLDGSGDYVVPRPAIANVESNEASGPFLYLFRAFVRDSGGPGRMRGGVGTAVAVTPYDTEALAAMMLGHGIEVPNSVGLFGGRPGSCGRNFLRRALGEASVIVASISSLAELDSYSITDLGPKPGNLVVRKGDVIGYTFQGGGGYGDPLRRDVQRVAEDVRAGHVSVDRARSDYGVVIRRGDVDSAATEYQRRAIRSDRLGGSPASELAHESHGLPEIRAERGRFVTLAGYDLGPTNGNWKASARLRNVNAGDYGSLIRLHPDLEIREFSCPISGALLEVEIVRKNESSLVTIELSG
jgi:N-methylhydantoinase B